MLDLVGAAGTYDLHWFNPREGGALVGGTPANLAGGSHSVLSSPSAGTGLDWVALVRLRADDDEDGLPNAWEALHGPDNVSVDPFSDDDEDGLTAAMEYVFGNGPGAYDAIIPYRLSVQGPSGDLFLSVERNAPAEQFMRLVLDRSTDMINWTSGELPVDLDSLADPLFFEDAHIGVETDEASPGTFLQLRAIKR